MKKLVLTLVVAISALNCVRAQEINYGVKAGLNLSKLMPFKNPDAEEIDKKTLLGLNLGGFVEIPVLTDTYFETGIYYSQTGGKYQESKYQESKITLNEINIPLKLKYNVYDNLFLNAGGYVSYGLSALYIKYFRGREVDRITPDDWNRFDYGILIGGEYQINNKFIIFANYNHGLANLQKNEEGTELKKRTFQLGVGYKL